MGAKFGGGRNAPFSVVSVGVCTLEEVVGGMKIEDLDILDSSNLRWWKTNFGSMLGREVPSIYTSSTWAWMDEPC